MDREVVVEFIIKFRVDGVPFEISILPNGCYHIFGPLWRSGGDSCPIFSKGKLPTGIIVPSLIKSIADLVRLKLKSEA